jgi:hypothetical protein
MTSRSHLSNRIPFSGRDTGRNTGRNDGIPGMGGGGGGGGPFGGGGGEGNVGMMSGRVEDDDGDLPLELEHMLGFTGSRLGTLLAHPTKPDVFIKSMGSAIVVGDLNDPHQQEFLRGHDMEITAMDVSPSGNLLASGQLGTVHRKGYGAPVIVWDLNSKLPIFTLPGHTGTKRRLFTF